MTRIAVLLSTALVLGSGCGDDDRPGGTTDGGGGTDSGGGGTDSGGGGTDGGGGGTDGGGTGTDSGGTDTDGGAGGAWETYCTVDGPARDTRCMGGGFDVTECQESGACLETIFIDGILDDVAACLGARDCGESDDPCYSPETHGLSASPAATAYGSDCNARRGSCAAGTAFSDDFCFPGLASNETIGRMDACLELPDCGEVRSCLIDIVTCAE